MIINIVTYQHRHRRRRRRHRYHHHHTQRDKPRCISTVVHGVKMHHGVTANRRRAVSGRANGAPSGLPVIQLIVRSRCWMHDKLQRRHWLLSEKYVLSGTHQHESFGEHNAIQYGDCAHTENAPQQRSRVRERRRLDGKKRDGTANSNRTHTTHARPMIEICYRHFCRQ